VGLGRSPHRGPEAEPGQGVRGGEAPLPLKLKSFEPSQDRGWQICHTVNCSNILLEKVFVSPLPSLGSRSCRGKALGQKPGELLLTR